jgi:hypothetical protein
LYLTYAYPSPYPTSLYYSPSLSCYMDPNSPNTCYPYYSTSPSYPNPYSSSPYQITTQTSYATETTTSTPAPAMVLSTITNEVTNVVATTDNSSETFYGVVIAVLLILLGACVFLLLLSASKTSTPPTSYGATGYYCRNCGNHLNQPDRAPGRGVSAGSAELSNRHKKKFAIFLA